MDDLKPRMGYYLSDKTKTYWLDESPVLYEVLHPLTIEEVVEEVNFGDGLLMTEWELSGQLIQNRPVYIKGNFKFYIAGTITFYQKIEQ